MSENIQPAPRQPKWLALIMLVLVIAVLIVVVKQLMVIPVMSREIRDLQTELASTRAELSVEQQLKAALILPEHKVLNVVLEEFPLLCRAVSVIPENFTQICGKALQYSGENPVLWIGMADLVKAYKDPGKSLVTYAASAVLLCGEILREKRPSLCEVYK